jgi:membrane protein
MRTNPRAKPTPSSILVSIFGAALLGTAASVIHGAFDRIAVDARRPATLRTAQVARTVTQRPGAPGEGAAAPSDIPAPGWWSIAKRTFSEVNNDRVLAVAGGVTFYGLLSLFPAITVLVSVYGLFANRQSIADHLQMLNSFLPEGAMSIIGEQVTRITEGNQATLGLAVIFGLLVAMWSANAATKAMMEALNIAYGVVEKRSFLLLNAVSLAFTLSAIFGLIVMFAIVAVVPLVLSFFMLGPVADVLLSVGRWPLMFLLSIAALAVLYQWGPSRRNVKWRWITPGSIFATIGLLLLSMLFSWYAANFGKFNETYGSLGAAIGFMTWLWLSSTIVMVGAEVNSEIENQAKSGPKTDETGESKKA